MSDKLYMEKEESRMTLEQALSDYRESADAYGLTQEEKVEEITSCLSDAMMADLQVVID